MCELLGVSPSGYYAWVKRRPSRRSHTDAVLITRIRTAHDASRGTYGAPRVHAELAAQGIRIGRKRVARLMAQAGLAGVSRRKFVTTTIRGDSRQAPDLVGRNFTAERPNLLWVADITYIPTWAGFLYLAIVLDACSRRIVGWSMATTLGTQLVLDALNMALVRTKARNTPQSRSGIAAARPASAPRWARSATLMTTPCARASSPRSNVNFSRVTGSRPRPRRASRCSSSSRVFTIRAAVIRRLDIYPRSITSVCMRSIPAHASLPSCSRPSRTSPPGGPEMGPSLTAAARAGRTIVRAGTEEWLRRGPNKRMAQNRGTTCCQTRCPDPKRSPVHEIGASPYGLNRPGISVAIIVAVNGLGTKLNNTFSNINSQLR